jgi:hypothetical protein
MHVVRFVVTRALIPRLWHRRIHHDRTRPLQSSGRLTRFEGDLGYWRRRDGVTNAWKQNGRLTEGRGAGSAWRRKNVAPRLPWRVLPSNFCERVCGGTTPQLRIAPRYPLRYFPGPFRLAAFRSSSSCSFTRFHFAAMSFGGQTPTIVVLREGRRLEALQHA